MTLNTASDTTRPVTGGAASIAHGTSPDTSRDTPRNVSRDAPRTAPEGASHSKPSYLRAWQHLPRNLGFLFATLPLGVAGFVTVVTLVITGVALTIIWVGIPILVAGLLAARGFGGVELARLKAAGQAPIENPDWRRVETTRLADPGRASTAGATAHFWSRLSTRLRARLWGWFARLMHSFGAVLGDGRNWVRVVFVAPVNFAMSIVSWVFAVVWTAGGLGGVSYWFWVRFLPEQNSSDNVWLHQVVWHFFDPSYTVEPTLQGKINGESVFFALAGAVLLLTLPLVAATFVAAHQGIARGMLSEWRSVKLERRAQEAEASRESALLAEDHSLRRLERDIHDGPQQRLIRLQFDVASAQRALVNNPAVAAELLDSALEQSREALEELRELSRGFAPPILQDRGLEAALHSLAARSPLPTTVRVNVQNALTEVAEVERSIYFIASELLTNAIKHAGATQAEIVLSVSQDSSLVTAAASGATSSSLSLLVSDNGRGGAMERAGHGLGGIRERLAGLRGTLDISSPTGGPTLITARIPLKSVL